MVEGAGWSLDHVEAAAEEAAAQECIDAGHKASHPFDTAFVSIISLILSHATSALVLAVRGEA
jgi:hypothetical protein